ncbi:MAG TPA: alpha/beta fold hydrolase [Gemmatimonas sp.]|uniref:alpha/beta hydrolase family protein n=1 Tax=Gemmatimonas sp. TaxID=1962908 RepID=UPI002ED95953
MSTRRKTLGLMLGALSCTLLGATSRAHATGPEQVRHDPRALFRHDSAAPLAIVTEPVASLDTGITMQRISYASRGGDRASGVIAVPNTAGPHPAVLLLHGLPGNAEQAMRAVGYSHARRGAIVLSIDAPWARRGSLPSFTVQDSVDQVQLIHDLRRAVDLLRQRSDVDPKRIAYVGGSYGGAMGTLFLSVEDRIAAGILFVPDGGMVDHMTNRDGSPARPLAELPATAQARWLAAMRPIEPIRFANQIRTPALLVQNGRRDQYVSTEDAEALHRALPQHTTVEWYDSGHGLPSTASQSRHAWLAKQIGTRP